MLCSDSEEFSPELIVNTELKVTILLVIPPTIINPRTLAALVKILIRPEAYNSSIYLEHNENPINHKK